MAGVVMVSAIVVLARATEIVDIVVGVDMLFIGVLADVEIMAVAVLVIVLKFVLAVPYSVDVSSGVDVGMFINASADVMLAVLTGIGIEVMADVNPNTFAGVMTALEFSVTKPLAEFSR